MTRWPSPAKLNLFLYITGQRADGYHTLQTLFQFLDYGDTLTIEPRSDGQLRLLTPVAGVPDEENLIVRAARLLMHAASESDRLPAGSGADISIDKRLPMGGGRAVAPPMPPPCWWRSTICGAAVSRKMSWRLLAFSWGRCAGFRTRPCRLRRGVGEILTPVEPEEKWYRWPTRGQYSDADHFRDPELPRNTPRRSINTLLNCEFSNDCELIARKRFREVDAALSGC